MAETSQEIHLFVLWPHALVRRHDILADLAREFVILDVVEVSWTLQRFGQNLERLYSTKLPPNSKKMRHCGVGPFLAVVVKDDRPAYAERPTTSGRSALVNARSFDARARYRSWTGGGHRVHATMTPPESDHDIFLLLGRRTTAYPVDSAERWDGIVRSREQDVIGAGSRWRLCDLFDALEVATSYVVVSSPEALTSAARAPARDHVPQPTILVGDIWEAHFVAEGRPGGRGFTYALIRASIEDRAVVLHFRQTNAGYLDERWEATILRNARRGAEGGFVAAAEDLFYVRLYESLVHGRPIDDNELTSLGALARAQGLPAGDYRDSAFLGGVLRRYLATHAYGFAKSVDSPADVATGRTSETLSRLAQRSLRPGRKLWWHAHRMLGGLTRGE